MTLERSCNGNINFIHTYKNKQIGQLIVKNIVTHLPYSRALNSTVENVRIEMEHHRVCGRSHSPRAYETV